MNYIKHLNNWFELMKTKEEIKPTHISLYLALFYLWNQNRFASVFSINRQEMMNIGKIGSFTTYSKCMRELHSWGWITYFPSTSKYGISTVYLTSFENVPTASQPFTPEPNKKPTSGTTTDSTTDTTSDTTTPSRSKQEVGHSTKEENRDEKIIPNLKTKYHEPL
ncbi:MULTISPECIES: hypothetical protein [unclassified Myroides]|uniref:hypothetical protein n=1 Tax=unclassified Myroides TaxID=2642485 RepID=UPI003D2F8652